MNGILRNDQYKKNFNFLVKAIKQEDEKKIDKWYYKIISDLSETLEGLTDKAEDVARYILRDDLDNYYLSFLNKKRSNIKIFGVILNKVLGKDRRIKNIGNFVKMLPYPDIEIAIECINILKRFYSLKNKETSTTFNYKDTFLDTESEFFHIYEGLNHRSSLKNEIYKCEKEVSDYRKEEDKSLKENLQSFQLTREEPVYATISIEHIEAKKKHRRERLLKYDLVTPKLPKSMMMQEKTPLTSQEMTQKLQAAFRDTFAVSLQSENLDGNDNQKINTKPRIVGFTLKESFENIVSRPEDYSREQQIVQTNNIGALSSVLKDAFDSKTNNKVKTMVKNFERDQVEACMDIQPVKSQSVMITQSGINIQKNSLMSSITKRCDNKSCKDSFLTHVSVKRMIQHFENYEKER
ncbi:MAG: hypothetical protein LKM44_02065 [Wolbachia endosymbiont of Meromenopon meropis]|nr:hypothetical protein [Wolbachia endosymbiont of Meromenopon meropis]